MKRRPRRIESEVAKHLTQFSIERGCSQVRRIPVLGRTGPDIEINELNLVVDVKSRQQVPKLAMLKPGEFARFEDGLLGVRLDELYRLYTTQEPNTTRPSSTVIRRWFEHMEDWRRAHCDLGVSVLVLHRPGTPVKRSAVVIHQSERSKLYGP
jgi:hypothetical protein